MDSQQRWPEVGFAEIAIDNLVGSNDQDSGRFIGKPDVIPGAVCASN